MEDSYHQQPTESKLQQFFSMLLQGTTGDMEARRMFWDASAGKYVQPQSIASRDLDELIPFAQRPGDVFFGINTRKRGVINATKSDVLEIVCIAVDIDFKTIPHDVAERRLATFCFKPTVVIFSGNGLHVYWLLLGPVLRTAETQAFFESVSKNISKQLGGDSTHDINRVLRVPGFVNSKYPDKPMCKSVSQHGPRYDAANFERFADVAVCASPRVVKVQPATAIPPKFQTLLARNSKLKATVDGNRPDLKDQTRSAYDQSLASQLSTRGFSPDELDAVLLANPSGKGADGSPAYRRLTIAKAFAPYLPGSDSPSGTTLQTTGQSTQSTLSSFGGEASELEALIPSGRDGELQGLVAGACRTSRELASHSVRWISPTFHFLRFLRSREEFCQMDEKELRDSELWRCTDFTREEILRACVEWPKVKPGFAKNRLFAAMVLAEQRPVRSCEHWAHLKTYITFLSLAYHLQVLTGDGEIFLPCHKVGDLIHASPETVSAYRRMALTDGFLTATAPHTRRKATRFRVDLVKFKTFESLH